MRSVTDKIKTCDFRRVKAEDTDQPATVEEVCAKCEVYCTTSGQARQISLYYKQFFEDKFILF